MKFNVTNEELMSLYVQGDSSALSRLCEQNRGLICDRAKKMALAYNCYDCVHRMCLRREI